MRVQILGTGCPKCRQLMANVAQAIRETGVDAEVEKIDKLADIAGLGVMMTPALAIDGEVRSAGKVLSPQQIAEMLAAAG